MIGESSNWLKPKVRTAALGYLLKGTPAAAIIEAIQDEHRGGSPMTSTIARQMIGYFQRESPPLDEMSNLTSAAQACVSLATVRTHLRNLYEKLQVHSRAELIARALGRNQRIGRL